MLRQAHTAILAAVLSCAYVQAPFSHVHPDDPDHHHAKGFTHAHLGLPEHDHVDEGPEIEPHEDDELAIYLDWAPAASSRINIDYAEAAIAPIWEPQLSAVAWTPELRPSAHSPPQVPLLPARSPPI